MTTTITTSTTPEIQSSAPGDEPTFGQLRVILSEFETATAALNVFADQADDRETIWRLVLPWLPLAEKRLREADCSPADQARWLEIITDVQRPDVDAEIIPDVGTLIHAAWRLLCALLAASRKGPGVREITERIRESVANGSYPPGSLLAVGRIAAEVGCPLVSVGRVRLAVRDLEAEGLITFSSADRIHVAYRSEAVDRPDQIAAWLCVLIQAGVYPPGSKLPTRLALGRALVSAQPFVADGLQLLHEQNVVTNRNGVRTVVRPTLPFPVVPPPDVDSLLPRLWDMALPGMDLSPTGIRAVCHRAHTWWRSRLAPHPETLHHTLRTLAAAAEYLLPLAAGQHPNNPDVHATLRRTAVTALAAGPSNSDGQIWRAACLGAAVREVLDLAGDAA